MNVNEHVDNALDWQHGDAEPSTFALQNAHIEATLALAYEQRTANMIALYRMDDNARQGMIDGAGMHSEHWVSVTQQIKKRLGL